MQSTTTGLRLTVKAAQLTAGVKACAMARDKGKNALPALSDYRLELEGDKLLIVSTDRYKLIRVTITGENIEGNIDGLSVDGAQLEAIAAHKLARVHDYTVTLDISGDGVTATFLDGAILRATATGRDFPKYRAIIEGDKGDTAPVIGFTARYLQDIAKACEIVAGKDKGYLTACLGDKHKPATFTANGDGVEITALLMPVRIKD
jgi:DNA polymerase III sliding clamp (beta) subunit (PCNA family)